MYCNYIQSVHVAITFCVPAMIMMFLVKTSESAIIIYIHPASMHALIVPRSEGCVNYNNYYACMM